MIKRLCLFLLLSGCADLPIRYDHPQVDLLVFSSLATENGYVLMQGEDWLRLDMATRRVLSSAEKEAYQRWHNPETGAEGWVSASGFYHSTTGGVCRALEQAYFEPGSGFFSKINGRACKGFGDRWLLALMPDKPTDAPSGVKGSLPQASAAFEPKRDARPLPLEKVRAFPVR